MKPRGNHFDCPLDSFIDWVARLARIGRYRKAHGSGGWRAGVVRADGDVDGHYGVPRSSAVGPDGDRPR